MKNMKFDYVISNPPYGKSGTFGSKITKKIVDEVDFNEYINLLPSNGYAYNELYKNVKIYYGKILFGEASTDPCIVSLYKEDNGFKSFEDFEIENVYNLQFKKFFLRQQQRNDVIVKHYCNKNAKDFDDKSSKNTFATSIFVTEDGVYSIREGSGEKLWNLDNFSGKLNEAFIPKEGKENACVSFTEFRTGEEKINFSNWWYSSELAGKGPRNGLATKLLKALNTTTSRPYRLCIPKVDWSRPWTDSEILADYGYTKEEIEQILKEENPDAN